MSIYFVATKACSNIPIQNLRYDLSIYRTYVDENHIKHKYELLPKVTNQQFLADYVTQSHQVTTNDPLSTIYIVELNLYPQNCAFDETCTNMYTLEELTQGKAFAYNKRENACYFVTELTATADVNCIRQKIEISAPERAFIAKEYPIGHIDDPFAKNKIENELKIRLNPNLELNFALLNVDELHPLLLNMKLSDLADLNPNLLNIDKFKHIAPNILELTPLDIAKFGYYKHPNQGDASLCGPATLFYCLLRDRPDIYAQATRELWEHGRTKIGNLTIAPKHDCRHPFKDFYSINKHNIAIAKISGLDWITLASLRDSENLLFDYDEISDELPGITYFGFSGWFEKVGYQKILDNTGIFRSIIGKRLNKQDILRINTYYKQGYTVILLVSSAMLYKGDKSSTKDHWIVLESAIVDKTTQKPITNNTPSNTFIDLTIFSWGKVQSWRKSWLETDKYTNKTLGYFMNNTFGFLVFKKII